MVNLFEEINRNLDKTAIYCLCTHDFTHKNNRNLLMLINFLRKLETNKKLKITNVKNV